jgi:MYXO-CTERM domain-containing protein
VRDAFLQPDADSNVPDAGAYSSSDAATSSERVHTESAPVAQSGCAFAGQSTPTTYVSALLLAFLAMVARRRR